MIAVLNLAPHADQKMAAEALERRQRADYNCYMVMRRYRSEILSALTLAVREGLDREAHAVIVRELELAIKERETANEEFLSALSGHQEVEL